MQANRTEYTLEGFDAADPPILTIVEWKAAVHETLYLCSSSGIAIDFVKPPRTAPGFEYTAYRRRHGIEERAADLALIEAGHPVLSPC